MLILNFQAQLETVYPHSVKFYNTYSYHIYFMNFILCIKIPLPLYFRLLIVIICTTRLSYHMYYPSSSSFTAASSYSPYYSLERFIIIISFKRSLILFWIDYYLLLYYNSILSLLILSLFLFWERDCFRGCCLDTESLLSLYFYFNELL